MSTLTKKQQKSQSFRTKGGKPGKKEAPIPEDVPEQDLLGDDDDDEDEVPAGTTPTTNITQTLSKEVDLNSTTEPDGKKKSKSKLSKEKKLREKLARESGVDPKQQQVSVSVAKPAGEKRKREEEDQVVPKVKVDKGKKKAVDQTETEISTGAGAAEGEETEEGKEKKKTKKDIKQRFILFVGHLSFKTTSSELAAYFARETGHSPSVRLLTTKPPGPPKSRGIAFIEFPTSTLLQSALKLHHTELEGKRINVELTAGGGGTTGERKRKIEERNQRVGEQRVKRKEREAEEDGEEVEGESTEVGEDGQPVKKKTKVRGGRRGKTDEKDDGALPGWSARKSGTFATSGSGPTSRGRGRGGARGGRGRSDAGGRGGAGGGGGGGRYWQPTGSNATTVG